MLSLALVLAGKAVIATKSTTHTTDWAVAREIGAAGSSVVTVDGMTDIVPESRTTKNKCQFRLLVNGYGIQPTGTCVMPSKLQLYTNITFNTR